MKKGLISICCLLLIGCGFHLRGAADIPTWLSPLSIVNQHASQGIARALQQMLDAYKLDTQSTLKSRNQIVLEDDNVAHEINGIAASTAPRQYQLIYTLHYFIQTPQLHSPIQTLKVTRQITINNDRILGSDAEEAITIADMHREASGLLLSQLSHLTQRE